MKGLFFSFALILETLFAIAQEKALDYAVTDSWPILQGESISNDGRFAAYCINFNKMGQTWVIQATGHPWKKELTDIKEESFTPNSRQFVFINKNDSLGILDLGKDNIRYFGSVISFKQPACGDGHWMGFLLKEPTDEFILFNLFTTEERRYSHVKCFIFDDSSKVLLLQLSDKVDSIKTQSTVWVNLVKNTTSTIDHNLSARYFAFDESSKQLAFLAEQPASNRNIWVLKYYQTAMENAKVIVDSSTKGMNGLTLMVDDISFSKYGDKILFRAEKPEIDESAKTSLDSAQVNIRDYKDEQLPDPYNRVWAVTSVNGPTNVIRLEQEDDFKEYGIWTNNSGNSDYMLAEGISSHTQDPYKPLDQFLRNVYLVSTKDGSRKLIKENCIIYARFSMMGRYVIWYDRERNEWYTYRISNGVTTNITKRIPMALYSEVDDHSQLPRWEGVGGWLENDKAVLIYDRYDIWQVDPDGIKAPINITSGFGRRNHIRLRYIDFEMGSYGDDFNKKYPIPIHSNDTLLLSAFNVINKDNGFFALSMGKVHQLRKLIMGKDTYFYPDRPWSKDIMGIVNPEFPVKAKQANAYLIRKMNADEYPNLNFTTNFNDFKPLTELEPQKEFNWYSTELIHFKLPNGRLSEAILYRPQDFDARKKYPVIFYYYERNADALHSYISPELSNGSLNIPWFVSHGYLVCVPDIIYYKRGYPGECAYKAINAAADVLCRRPWVNAKAMGLQGHSYGGWETNYIVTRTHRFAAAAPASGFCDAVSFNSQVSGELSGYFEVYQGRLDASFWREPKLYIRNSPIFNADKVTTPMLILHNITDPQAPFVQSKEWYDGLAHLKKKAWLLSYNDDHSLADERNQLDYSIRLAQFFDHYLRGAPPPKWMTADKHTFQGRSRSLELDLSGAEP